jgi:hypothetical protein
LESFWEDLRRNVATKKMQIGQGHISKPAGRQFIEPKSNLKTLGVIGAISAVKLISSVLVRIVC